MVKFSRSSAYTIEALTFLARQEPQRNFTAAHIAELKGLSTFYMRKVMEMLVAVGILRSLRGPNGGYCMRRPARDITLLEVVEAVDGPIRGDAPALDGDKDGPRLNHRLAATDDEVTAAWRERLRAISVADLARDRK